MIADLLLERAADGVEIDVSRDGVEIVDAEGFAKTPDGIIRRRDVDEKERDENGDNYPAIARTRRWRRINWHDRMSAIEVAGQPHRLSAVIDRCYRENKTRVSSQSSAVLPRRGRRALHESVVLRR